MHPRALTLSLFITFLASFQANAADKSCAEAIGQKRAESLVKQCINVSPATHPPCNAANSCGMINSEVDRGCGLLGDDPNAPAYCHFNLTKPETLQGALITGGGIDDYTITVLVDDGRRFTAYCDGRCGDWFVTNDESEATLLPPLVGKAVKVTVASEPNNDRIAGPAAEDSLIFVKKIEFVK